MGISYSINGMNKASDYFARFGAKNVGGVTWSHAVNSKEKLERVMTDPSIMAIEADIRESSDGTIICAHPPETTSDLSFDAFLAAVRPHQVALKLDIKDAGAVAPVLAAVSRAALDQLVILNADVLQGNGAKIPPFRAEEFIVQCVAAVPDALLSLGWTTVADPEFGYTKHNVDAMFALTEKLGQVTFPVRASLLPSSWDELQRLLLRPGRTFTVWNNEPVDADLAAWIQEETDPEFTFYDFIDTNGNSVRLW